MSMIPTLKSYFEDLGFRSDTLKGPEQVLTKVRSDFRLAVKTLESELENLALDGDLNPQEYVRALNQAKADLNTLLRGLKDTVDKL